MRAHAAALSRDRWRPMAGDWVDSMSDAEMMDSIDYTLFPNFTLGAHLTESFIDSDQMGMITEFNNGMIFLAPYKKGQKPDPAPVHWLTETRTLAMLQNSTHWGKSLIRMYSIWVRFSLGLETTQKTGNCA
ncbi:MAG: hypothetical protein Ct9H90mP5_10480 [Acidimicrobiaceae bacterium]|nr:MAG: hypothetical protein Ct9H90mP5_10480 [Acidimicrobiaceae bacterium]